MTGDATARGQSLEVRSERAGSTHTLYLAGELDSASAPTLGREIDWVELGDPKALVLDISALTFIDSAGISLLLCVDSRLGLGSNSVRVVGAAGQVRRVLEATGVSEHLDLAD